MVARSALPRARALVRQYLELSGYVVLAEAPSGASATRNATASGLVAAHLPYRPAGPAGRVFATFLGADPALDAPVDALDVVVATVRDGPAGVPPALDRVCAVMRALRLVGGCPAERLGGEAWAISEAGAGRVTLADGTACRVRLVCFARHGRAPERGVRTIALAACARFVRRRRHQAAAALDGLSFADPERGLLALEDRLAWPAAGARVG